MSLFVFIQRPSEIPATYTSQKYLPHNGKGKCAVANMHPFILYCQLFGSSDQVATHLSNSFPSEVILGNVCGIYYYHNLYIQSQLPGALAMCTLNY